MTKVQEKKNEEFISLVHEAMSSLPILVYNGQEQPVERTLPTALLHISQVVKEVKQDVAEQNKLLVGMKQRKKIIESFFNVFILTKDWIKHTALGKILLFLVAAAIFIKGFIAGIEMISNLF